MTERTLPCVGYQVTPDDDPWFSTDPERREFAAEICQPCPAREACKARAVEVGERWGVFGGVDFTASTEAERRKAVAA